MNFNRRQLESQFKKIGDKFLVEGPKKAEATMNAAVNIVYRTARQKRSMIGKKGVRVSDPSSPFGVAVAESNGGRLRESIKKEVTTTGGHVIGRVYQEPQDAVYGKRIEFGFKGEDSLGRVYDQPPRPFMRPAWDLNKETVLRMFKDFWK